MNKTVWIGVAALVVTCVCETPQAFAQRPEQAKTGGDPIQEFMFPPELIMQHQRALGLAEEQKTRIRSHVGEAQGRFTEIQWTLQDAMEALMDLVAADPADEEAVLQQLDEVLDAEREMKRAQISLMVRLKNALTPEQREQLRALKQR